MRRLNKEWLATYITLTAIVLLFVYTLSRWGESLAVYLAPMIMEIAP